MDMKDNKIYDVLVVGGGHAGCEAALAAARMGLNTLLVTSKIDSIGKMPCNPSIGGLAKSHLVYEIDALGGEMGRNADKTALQSKILNSSRGVGLADMCYAILNNRRPRCHADIGYHAIEVIHGILESARTGKTYEMTTRCERPAPIRTSALSASGQEATLDD